jgi:hypothetical protein
MISTETGIQMDSSDEHAANRLECIRGGLELTANVTSTREVHESKQLGEMI